MSAAVSQAMLGILTVLIVSVIVTIVEEVGDILELEIFYLEKQYRHDQYIFSNERFSLVAVSHDVANSEGHRGSSTKL